ncbi:MAG: hypothetical protein AB7S39_10200 [Gemmatimonadales bacterium]
MLIDLYTLRARVFPVYLATAPALLAVAAALPTGANVPLTGLSAVVLLPLAYLFGQIAADRGKRIEPRLWRSWGGVPTVRYLRHDNDEFNAGTRLRVHTALQSLGLAIPTAAEERADQQRAVKLYEAAVEELRRLTRDAKRFPLVREANIEYGFRRNLLGLKGVGLFVTVSSALVIGYILWTEWNAQRSLAPVPLVCGLLCLTVLLAWVLGVRGDAVRLPAERYARFLLEASLGLAAS